MNRRVVRASIVARERKARNRKSAGLGHTGLAGVPVTGFGYKTTGLVPGPDNLILGSAKQTPAAGSADDLYNPD